MEEIEIIEGLKTTLGHSLEHTIYCIKIDGLYTLYHGKNPVICQAPAYLINIFLNDFFNNPNFFIDYKIKEDN